jgi:CPA2 family monovalent cation:H+ antiporter-2
MGIHILPSIVILIGTAVIVVAVFKYLKLSPVLGYLVAGTLIGDYGFKVVSYSETSSIAELGVVFLLFAIGLELSFERLKAMRRYVLGLGSLQVILSSISIAFIAIFFIGNRYNEAILIGGGLALSSTAIVLQVLSETKNHSSQVGRISLSILLQQDFSVIPLLVLVPILASSADAKMFLLLGEALLKAVIVLAAIFISGRLLLRPLFRLISSDGVENSEELFVAATLLIVLTAAWGTEEMGLSLALGAFVAGILVAETEFRVQAEESIAPFKGLFLGLFFMSVGMGIDVKEIYANIGTVIAVSLCLITVKAVIITLLCLLFGFNKSTSIHAGLLLSQGGEFAFILFNLGIDSKIIDPHIGKILLLTVTFTMALTPLLNLIGIRLAGFFSDIDQSISPLKIIEKGSADLNNHIIISGFGKVGNMIARVLEAEEINYIAVDIDESKVKKGNNEGYPVFLGDFSKIETLKAAGLLRSSIAIITTDNIITTKKTIKLISENSEDIIIIAKVKDFSHANEFYEAGASIILPEIYEIGLQLGCEVLKVLGINNYEINRIKMQFRAGNYLTAQKDIGNVEFEEYES